MSEVRQKGSLANQSAEKMLTIIEYLAEKKQPMRLLHISKDLGINTSTALRFLTTLVNCGYAEQEEDTAKYYLTFKICAVANKVSSQINVREIAKPYMKQLSEIFGESVCLAVVQSMKVVYIEVVEGPGPDQMLRTMQRIGNIAPMHCTGIGKLFLTEYTDSEIDRFIESMGLNRFTEYTLTSKLQLVEELKQIKQRGYAYDNEECEIGARCVAFPIYDNLGKVIAGISVTGPANRLTNSYIEGRLQYLHQTTQDISYKMGFEIAKS